MVLLAVDDCSIERLGPWPFSRAAHAQLIERLGSAAARVIAFDVLFAEGGMQLPADRAFAQAAAGHQGGGGSCGLPAIR